MGDSNFLDDLVYRVDNRIEIVQVDKKINLNGIIGLCLQDINDMKQKEKIVNNKDKIVNENGMEMDRTYDLYKV